MSYARQHLAPWAETETSGLQRAMACLAFDGDTSCQPYAALFSREAWDELAEAFTLESRALDALPPDSPFTAHLQAGLSALKVGPSNSYPPGNLDDANWEVGETSSLLVLVCCATAFSCFARLPSCVLFDCVKVSSLDPRP